MIPVFQVDPPLPVVVVAVVQPPPPLVLDTVSTVSSLLLLAATFRLRHAVCSAAGRGLQHRVIQLYTVQHIVATFIMGQGWQQWAFDTA